MRPYRVSLWRVAAILACALGSTASAQTQNYPSRTIKVMVSTAPGGLLDILPRILGQKITEATGQAVVIENKTGGNGAVAGGEVAKSTPDGYTLMMGFHGVNAMLPHMTSKLTFDPTKDFIPVIHMMTVPNILVVHPSVPAKSVQELIAHAKANPGKLTYASQGVGSTGHVGGELFKQLAGVDITHVPYRGAAPAAQAVIGGQVSMMFDVVTLAAESVKAGRMNALGLAWRRRSAIRRSRTCRHSTSRDCRLKSAPGSA
jgi:tripartite-type tricarboxylate transporter receptor subunit TctC